MLKSILELIILIYGDLAFFLYECEYIPVLVNSIIHLKVRKYDVKHENRKWDTKSTSLQAVSALVIVVVGMSKNWVQ